MQEIMIIKQINSFQQQRQEATQINDITEISGENYELGYGIKISQGLKGFNLGVIDSFKFQDYWQREYKQKLLHGMKIDDYMKYVKPELLLLSRDENEAYEIFEKYLVKQNKILEKYGEKENDKEKTIVTAIL